MLTARAQLEAAFEKNQVVVVCWEPDCSLHRLSHWTENRWISCAKRPGYTRYSHGICPAHAQQLLTACDLALAAA